MPCYKRVTEFEQYEVMRQVLGFRTVKPGMLYLFGTGYEHVRSLAKVIAASPPDVIRRLRNPKEISTSKLMKERRAEDYIISCLRNWGPPSSAAQLFQGTRTSLRFMLALWAAVERLTLKPYSTFVQKEIPQKSVCDRGYLGP